MRTSKLASNTTYPFICSFNGSGTSANVGLKANALLKQFVTAQIGVTAAALFQDDFINYKDGFMLCQNMDTLLHLIFGSGTPASKPSGSSGSSGAVSNIPALANLRNTISFTPVRMPSTFKNQKGNLSENYQYGEKLMVAVSLEPLEDEGTIKPTGSQQAKGPITKGPGKNKKRGVLFFVYRDGNIKARTLKSQSGGGGIGVWS